MSEKTESEDQEPFLFQQIGSLGAVASTLTTAKYIKKGVKKFQGCEGWVDIKVKNTLNKDIEIQLESSDGKFKTAKEVLENELTRNFNVKAWDGVLNTTHYRLDVWNNDHGHISLFVYGGGEAPRHSGYYEVREKGIFSLDGGKEDLMKRWVRSIDSNQ